MRKDTLVGLVCLIGSLLLYSTLGLIENPRAIIFPRAIIIFMGIFAFLMIVQSLVLAKKEDGGKGGGYPYFRFAALFCIIVAYLAVSERLGFYASAFLLFALVANVFSDKKPTIKKVGLKVLVSAVFTGVLFLLFSIILEVQTPRGLFL